MNYSDYLAHHGIKGQKWGVRRFQNADGSYTSAGRSRYGINSSANRALYKSGKKKLKNRLYSEYDRHENIHEEQIEAHNKKYGQYQNNYSGKNRKLNKSERKAYEAGAEKLWNEYESKMNESRANYKKDLKNLKQETGQTLKGRWNGLSDNQKKAIKVGAVVAGTALAAYATYKIAGPKIIEYRKNNILDKRLKTILKNSGRQSDEFKEALSRKYRSHITNTFRNSSSTRTISGKKMVTGTKLRGGYVPGTRNTRRFASVDGSAERARYAVLKDPTYSRKSSYYSNGVQVIPDSRLAAKIRSHDLRRYGYVTTDNGPLNNAKMVKLLEKRARRARG